MKMRTKFIFGFVVNLVGLLLLAVLTLGGIYFFGGSSVRQSIRNWLDPTVHESDLGFVNRAAKLCGPLTNNKNERAIAEPDKTKQDDKEQVSLKKAQAKKAEQKDIYVAAPRDEKTGDAAEKGTKKNPYRSLGQALCVAGTGQTVHVAPGVYRESVFLEKIGAPEKNTPGGAAKGDNDHNKPANRIKIVGESKPNKPDAQVILDGQDRLTYGLAIIESQNIIVKGLTFKNYTDAGLLAAKSQNVTIQNNVFKDNGRASIEPDYDGEGFGLHVGDSQQVVIKDNQVFGNGPGLERRQNGDLGTGIDTFSNQDVEITGNDIHDNFGGGVLVEDSQKVKVAFNKIRQNDLDASAYGWWDAGIWVDGGKTVTLLSNLIEKNRGPAIEISDEEHAFTEEPSGSLGFTVTNNQLRDNYFARFIFGYGQCPDPPTKVLIWRDNLEKNNKTDKPLLPEHQLDGQHLCLK